MIIVCLVGVGCRTLHKSFNKDFDLELKTFFFVCIKNIFVLIVFC